MTKCTCITLDNYSNRPKLLKLAHINSGSIVNKIEQFQQLITGEDINVCAITETCIKLEDNFTPKQMSPPHYDILSFSCLDCRQGGDDPSLQGPPSNESQQHQYQINKLIPQDYTVEISKECRFNLYVLYRYPPTSFINFCDEFLDMLETNIVRGQLVLIGDFNICMDSMNHPDTIIFNDSGTDHM